MVSPQSIEHICKLYIKPNHPIFDLLPTCLSNSIKSCYNHLGCPSVECSSIWTVYLALLDIMQQSGEVATFLKTVGDCDIGQNEELPLLPGLHNLHEPDNYMSGVTNGLGLQPEHLHRLDMFHDEPDVGDDANKIDMGPSLWVYESSSDDEDEINDIDSSL
ncbi:hypothetical protein PAXRUDRAFT_14577 [Paxillus rubicundulus Ve08.2h10]|uniref:Uncharacterized protein n=1 Tax=Paxillus rubicundulus Ve08.2h10 TaxID=930991 RepID=A0A0D0DNA0_9AGAM|nr:hypothetical protein PAXRUDRAFT_14577 [Paxillus rubicundulus Ve08.2h10]